MIKRIINYIEFLVSYVNPSEEVFLAVDGVAPQAKLNQQRKRRFRTIDDNKIRDEIKRRYGRKVNNIWNNTVITPGTVFMEKLHNELIRHFKNKYKSKSLLGGEEKKVKFTYSSYHTAGEGEHKILDDIKAKSKNKEDKERTYVIYGLDADLIFLSLASQQNKIYLLRESSQFRHTKGKTECFDPVEDVGEELTYVSIDETKECYNEQLEILVNKKIFDSNIKLETIKTKTEYVNDFVFICFLLGNDFLPHLPSIEINKGGLDTVLDAYIECFIKYKQNLVKVYKTKINIENNFLIELILNIGKREYTYFKEILPVEIERQNKKRCFESDPYARALWNLENMKNMKIDDPIKLGVGEESEWKKRYYEHYFKEEKEDEIIDKLTKMYLEGLKWVGEYYFIKCPSWTWQFTHSHAPFISDMGMSIVKNKLDINNIKFGISRPLKPAQQLLCVLPPNCSDIVPIAYQKLMLSKESPIKEIYPDKVELDMLYKSQYYQCIPILPHVEVEKIIEATKEIKLSKEEEIRNMEIKKYIFE